ncbi:MAG: hypothetical protein K9J04_00555, partial [Burkholderiales bacterium]|nr:hypothetical protein [Burkholderiales bacterium]
MKLKLLIAALSALVAIPSYAACPASDKSFANKRYQGTAEVYAGGNLVGTWTLSQLFDATGKVARGVVFKPEQPGEATSYT